MSLTYEDPEDDEPEDDEPEDYPDDTDDWPIDVVDLEPELNRRRGA